MTTFTCYISNPLIASTQINEAFEMKAFLLEYVSKILLFHQDTATCVMNIIHHKVPDLFNCNLRLL